MGRKIVYGSPQRKPSIDEVEDMKAIYGKVFEIYLYNHSPQGTKVLKEMLDHLDLKILKLDPDWDFFDREI